MATTKIIDHTILSDDGADFVVAFTPAMATAGYSVRGTLSKGSWQPGIFPVDDEVGDRTTTTFRVRLTAPLAAGDVVQFTLVHP